MRRFMQRAQMPVFVPALPRLCLWEAEFYSAPVLLERYVAFSIALEQHQIHSPVAQNLFPELLIEQHLANSVFWIEEETRDVLTWDTLLFHNAIGQNDHRYRLPCRDATISSSHAPVCSSQIRAPRGNSQVTDNPTALLPSSKPSASSPKAVTSWHQSLTTEPKASCPSPITHAFPPLPLPLWQIPAFLPLSAPCPPSPLIPPTPLLPSLGLPPQPPSSPTSV